MASAELIKKLLIGVYNYKRTKVFRRKINSIYKGLKNVNKSWDNEKLSIHRIKWGRLKSNISVKWYKVFSSVIGFEDENFIPEDIYYTVVEPCLNDKQLNKAYADKNRYTELYGCNLFPESLIHNIDGVYYNKDFKYIDFTNSTIDSWRNNYIKLIIKPAIDTGGGKAVTLFTLHNNTYLNSKKEVLSFEWLYNQFESNFIIQPFINQHDFFEKFNADSINTVRIFTYRSVKSNNVTLLHSLLRVGRKGSHVDNQASGGFSCGINEKGKLNNFAVNKYGERFNYLNDIDLNQEIIVPFYSEMIQLTTSLAKNNRYARLLGFDVYVDANNAVRLIEINNLNNEINFYQMNNGSLFGDYTDEVIEYCTKSNKSFVLDFYYK